MDDPVEASAVSNSNMRPDLPALRVHHLMAWMTATAFLISGCISFDRWARNGPAIRDPFAIGTIILIAICISGALSATGWGFYWRSCGRAFPKEPGQWLVVEIAAIVLALVLWVAGSFMLLWIEEDWIETFQALWGGFALIALVSMNLYVGLKRCDTRAWQIAVLSLMALGPLSAVFFAWAMLDDRQQRTRHWTHWFGAVVAVTAIVIVYVGWLRDTFF